MDFKLQLARLQSEHHDLLIRKNSIDPRWSNGLFDRYSHPVVSAAHTPLFWRYDINPDSNPNLIERMGINGADNVGAIDFNNKVCLMVRVEGYDRKSFFAVAESSSPVEGFRFWDYPVVIPETDVPDTNVYDMRLTRHEDGWIYGVFCTKHEDQTPLPATCPARSRRQALPVRKI